MGLTVPPSREVWRTSVLAACAELTSATDAATVGRRLTALVDLCARPPADVSRAELESVVRPVVAGAGAFIDGLAAP